MAEDSIIKKIRDLLGIDASADVSAVKEMDAAAAKDGVATKEIDPLAEMAELRAKIDELSAKLAKIDQTMSGFAQKEMVDQALAQGKRADDVLQQVKLLFVDQGTGRKEGAVSEEQREALSKEKAELQAPPNPWTASYSYQGGGA